LSGISYVKTYQVAYSLEAPLSDSIHYMPVRVALLVELGTDDPIAGYETRTGLAGFRDLIADGAVGIVQPDVIWSGA